MAQPARSFAASPREALFEEIVGSLRKLPERLRDVFIRSHYQGKTTAQIAREMGLAENGVRAMLRDANETFYRRIHRIRG